jgi:hypothetical protein
VPKAFTVRIVAEAIKPEPQIVTEAPGAVVALVPGVHAEVVLTPIEGVVVVNVNDAVLPCWSMA